MIYAEAVYFEGYHFAHIVAREEHQRLTRIRNQSRQAIERRRGSRSR